MREHAPVIQVTHTTRGRKRVWEEEKGGGRREARVKGGELVGVRRDGACERGVHERCSFMLDERY